MAKRHEKPSSSFTIEESLTLLFEKEKTKIKELVSKFSNGLTALSSMGIDPKTFVDKVSKFCDDEKTLEVVLNEKIFLKKIQPFGNL